MNSSINSREPFFMSLILRILILLKKKLYCFSPIEQIECDGKKKKKSEPVTQWPVIPNGFILVILTSCMPVG